MSRIKRHFGATEEKELLEAIGACRSIVIKNASQALFNRPVYEGCHKLTMSIDELAEVLTGDKGHFHLKMHSSPSGEIYKAK